MVIVDGYRRSILLITSLRITSTNINLEELPLPDARDKKCVVCFLSSAGVCSSFSEYVQLVYIGECIKFTVHCTVYILQCILKYIVYTVQCTFSTMYSA